MKRLFTLLILSAVLFSSCTDRAPERAARQFLQLYYIDHDFSAVKELVTESSLENLRQNALLFEFNPIAQMDAFQTFEIIEMNVQNTVAIADFRVDDVRRRLMLRRIDGRWLVDISNEVTQQGFDFSTSLSPPTGGGFASAESEFVRVGDVPERRQ